MGILGFKDASRVPRLDFELSSGCDHKCGHCYNVWNASEDDAQAGYPQGQLSRLKVLAVTGQLRLVRFVTLYVKQCFVGLLEVQQ